MHGGDVYNNTIQYDFSVNINPMGVPEEIRTAMIRSLDYIECYPEYDAGSLKRAISAKHGISSDSIICGNGASELISAICNAFVKEGSRVLIAGPAFSGYERAAYAVNAEIIYSMADATEDFYTSSALLEDILENRPGLVFLANPSNPAGMLTDREFICKLSATCKKVGALLVVDECFIELTGKEEEYSVLNGSHVVGNVIVLRAFTKSYAVPGIRLGYAVILEAAGDEPIVSSDASAAGIRGSLAKRLVSVLPEWNISVMAMQAGMTALSLRGYIEASASLIDRERRFVLEEIMRLGIKTYATGANYVLFYIDEKEPKGLYEFMRNRKILIRDCSDYEGLGAGYYRVAIRTHEENAMLMKELGYYKESCDA